MRPAASPVKITGEVIPPPPPQKLRAKGRPRHFAISTGCRGHPCRRKHETHRGFHFNCSSLSLKLPMPPHSRRKPLRPRARLSRFDRRDPISVLILERTVERHRPRFVGGHP